MNTTMFISTHETTVFTTQHVFRTSNDYFREKDQKLLKIIQCEADHANTGGKRIMNYSLVIYINMSEISICMA